MGTSWTSRKGGGILEKGGGMTPLTNYEGDAGVWGNLFKKKKLWHSKNEVLKICEKWYVLMQKFIKTTRFGGCVLQIFIKSTFKTWNTM